MDRVKYFCMILFVGVFFFLFYNLTESTSENKKVGLHSNDSNIFYMTDNGIIYKATFDTLKKERFNEKKYNEYKICDVNNEYVLMHGPRILMLDMDGEEVYSIQNEDIVNAVSQPILYNHKIYYSNIKDDNHIYAMSYCGEENQKVMAVSAEKFLIKDDIVYFSKLDDYYLCRLYKQELGGNEQELIIGNL